MVHIIEKCDLINCFMLLAIFSFLLSLPSSNMQDVHYLMKAVLKFHALTHKIEFYKVQTCDFIHHMYSGRFIITFTVPLTFIGSIPAGFILFVVCLSTHRLVSLCLSAQGCSRLSSPLRNSAGRPSGSKRSQNISASTICLR